ncbi:P-loop NTPase [Halorubrum sp. AD140]|uniref:P-loop NTPase n=1 Tax=Halorubrum sp. AD140 TaxID=3050073 RepID=UPI002ACD026A|nr:P-loop NTPase [Halorubrum sp. AD140]MDZ5812088.1 P-loop NTPase [Halorubrum sp. AD140]
MTEQRQPQDPFREITLSDGSDPIEKGIVRRVRRLDGTVTVDVAVGGLGGSLAERVVEQIRGAALTLDGADHVRVQPVRNEETTVDLPAVDRVLAVGSAKGGVGKTTVSVALARALDARGYSVGVFDADIYGPNVPHVLDVDGPILTNDTGQPVPLDADGVQLLSPGVAGGEPPTARRGAIAYGAVENLLAQGDWDDCDVLLVDLPAGNDDVVGALLEHVPLDGAVFVTTPFDASVDDTERTIGLFEEHGVPPVAAVVNMNRFVCDCCGEPNTLFDDPVDVDVPVVHELPFDRRLQRDPGHERAAEALKGVTATVDAYLTDLDEAVPDDAVDLRGLPPASQVRQLADDLAAAEPGETVAGVVEDPVAVEEDLPAAAGAILDEIRRSQPGTTGTLLTLSRRAGA